MKLIVVGPFPPPVHGMSKNLKNFFDDVSEAGEVLAIDTSPGGIVRGFSYHCTKIRRFLIGVFTLLKSVISGRVKCLYMPPDGGVGFFYTFLYVIVVCFFDVKVVFHHRTFSYVRRRYFLMGVVCFILKDRLFHVFLCERMKDGFFNNYYRSDYIVVSNAQYVKPISGFECGYPASGQFVMGHLSNLGFGKGVAQVLETHSKLKGMGYNVRLIIAGPFESEEVGDFVRKYVADNSDSVEYLGYLDAVAKDCFYRKIDLFLFPTEYFNEAQPNVVFEANAYAVPCASIGVGCIASDITSENGFCAGGQDTYVAEVVEWLIPYLECDLDYDCLRISTLNKIESESILSAIEYAKMVDLVVGFSK